MSGSREPVTNLVTAAVTPQAFSFAVPASNFTFEETYASPTQGDSLVVGLAVLNYGGGSALIEVADSAGIVPLRQTVSQSIAQGQTTVHGTPPYTVHIRFTGFSGLFALGVAAQTP